MKRACLLGIIIFCACVYSHAQKIQYSRQTVKKLYTDDIRLVANVNGNHHLLRFNVNKNPIIYIFNEQLQLISEDVINCEIKENVDTRVLSFSDHYYVYTHTGKTSRHALYKIDGGGNVLEFTKAFQQVADSLLNKSTATLQLINQDNRLYAMAHVYYDGLKSIGTTIVELNENIHPIAVRRAFYGFNIEEDRLQQTVLTGNSLLVLKTAPHEENGNSLDVVKVDLATGKTLLKSFNSASAKYSNVSLSLNQNDSNILLHATLAGSQVPRAIFISCLNHSLEEITPFALLQSSSRSHADVSYLLVEGYSGWLNIGNAFRRIWEKQTLAQQAYTDYSLTYYGAGTSPSAGATLPPDAQIIPTTPQSLPNTSSRLPTVTERRSVYPVSGHSLQSSIGFTVMNHQLKVIKDSVASVKRHEFGIQPQPFAQATINNIPGLFLIENFSESRRRLLMITGKNEQLFTTDINVFDKYEYVLEQLKAVNNHSVILPYIHKNGAGLVKISFN